MYTYIHSIPSNEGEQSSRFDFSVFSPFIIKSLSFYFSSYGGISLTFQDAPDYVELTVIQNGVLGNFLKLKRVQYIVSYRHYGLFDVTFVTRKPYMKLFMNSDDYIDYL